jgi:hypothetical protein
MTTFEELLIVLRWKITVETDQKRPRQNVWLPYAIQSGWELGRVCCPQIVEPSREGTVRRSGVPLLEVQGPHELGRLHSPNPCSMLLELPFLILYKDVSSMILRNIKLHGAISRKTVKFGSPRELYISLLNLRVAYKITSLLASGVWQNSEVHGRDLKFLRRFWEITPFSLVGG